MPMEDQRCHSTLRTGSPTTVEIRYIIGRKGPETIEIIAPLIEHRGDHQKFVGEGDSTFDGESVERGDAY